VGITLAVLAMLVGGACCAVYGARIRYDAHLKNYRPRDPFRAEQEQEGVLWIAGGAGLSAVSAALWWLTRS
jgi:hypothetical protein